MADSLPGAWPATIIEIETGTRCRRVRARVEGLFDETPYWCQPAGVPGAGGVGQGSMYPLQIDQQIYLFFLHGDPMAGAIYLTGPYGLDSSGAMPGPQSVNDVADVAEANKDIVLWEDEGFFVGFVYSNDRKQFRAIEKSTNTGIVINAADGGAGSAAKTLLLQSMTAMRMATNGLLQLTGAVLQLHNRRVQKIPQKPI